MLASDSTIKPGPYRATKLWNEAVRLFRTGMPVKKHRYLLKTYNDTFVGSEGVEWLHALLKANPNFGPHVTRAQTYQLLRKFLQNHVIEDINGKWGGENYVDGNQLYRFPEAFSPSKVIRQPLAMLNNKTENTAKVSSISADFVGAAYHKNSDKVILSPPSKGDNFHAFNGIENIESKCLIRSLYQVLHLKSEDQFIAYIHEKHILGNIKVVNLSEQHEMPFWVLSAMKCLANWPDNEDSDFPCYPGFERDVFAAVCGYFETLAEPLLTFKLFNFFIKITTRAKMLDKICHDENHEQGMSDLTIQNKVDITQRYDHQQDVVEKLERQLQQAKMRHENRAVRRRRSGRSRKIEFASSHNISQQAMHHDDYSSLRRSQWIANSMGCDLHEKATRQKWMERFHSIQALDSLSEENSNFKFESVSKHNNFSSSSVPDLLDCDDQFDSMSGINDANMSVILDDDIVAGAGYQENGPEVLYNREKFSSVENLLLNMSNDMRDEMEEELMASPCPVAEKENVYESIKSWQSNKSDEQSPLYRTMKPVVSAATIESPYMVMQRKKQVIKMAQLRRSQQNIHEMNKKENWRRSVCIENNRNLSNQPYVHKYQSLPRQHTRRHNNGNIGKSLNTLKPSTEELEEQLMESAVSYYHDQEQLIKPQASQNVAMSCANSYQNLKSNCLKKPKRTSSIVARREVPPEEVTTRSDNPNHVKSRVMRLPYVSDGMDMSNLHSSQNKPKPPVTRLCRSHSSLSHHRQPRMSELGLSHRHGSLHVLNTRPVAMDYNRFNDPIAIERKNRKSELNDFKKNNLLIGITEPQSPLSTAFATAKKQHVSEQADRPNHVIESLQLALLLIPPTNRSKLSLLLRLMCKIITNPHLVELDSDIPTRALLLEKFSPCILSRQDGSNPSESEKNIVQYIVESMLNHASIVMETPQKFQMEIKEIDDQRKRNLLQRKMTFCKQVPVEEFINNKSSHLHESLEQLLTDIVNNENIGGKEKRKKLKQFAKCYPEIYFARFPKEEPKPQNAPRRKSALFATAMQKLRGLRS